MYTFEISLDSLVVSRFRGKRSCVQQGLWGPSQSVCQRPPPLPFPLRVSSSFYLLFLFLSFHCFTYRLNCLVYDCLVISTRSWLYETLGATRRIAASFVRSFFSCLSYILWKMDFRGRRRSNVYRAQTENVTLENSQEQRYFPGVTSQRIKYPGRYLQRLRLVA